LLSHCRSELAFEGVQSLPVDADVVKLDQLSVGVGVDLFRITPSQSTCRTE
jgi:hypothetical protein